MYTQIDNAYNYLILKHLKLLNFIIIIYNALANQWMSTLYCENNYKYLYLYLQVIICFLMVFIYLYSVFLIRICINDTYYI